MKEGGTERVAQTWKQTGFWWICFSAFLVLRFSLICTFNRYFFSFLWNTSKSTPLIFIMSAPAAPYMVRVLVVLFQLCLFLVALRHFKQVLFMWQSWASWVSVQRVLVGNHNIFLDKLCCKTTKKLPVFPRHMIIKYLLFCNHSMIIITKMILRNPETPCLSLKDDFLSFI